MNKKLSSVSAGWKALLKFFPEEEKSLESLQKAIGYQFLNQHFLFEALCHRSALMQLSASKQGSQEKAKFLPWNERIEFLGDAVLSLAITEQLWLKNLTLTEGQLSKIRSSLVSEAQLASIAIEISLGNSIFLGKGERRSGGAKRASLLADAFEALVGAVFLDGGFAPAKAVVAKVFEPYLKGDPLVRIEDYKSALQEWLQERVQDVPEYRLLKQSGPDHARNFEVAVFLEGKHLATGQGATKKKASQEAAKLAWDKLNPKQQTKDQK